MLSELIEKLAAESSLEAVLAVVIAIDNAVIAIKQVVLAVSREVLDEESLKIQGGRLVELVVKMTRDSLAREPCSALSLVFSWLA
ncbi:hypothetical protein [Nesterenkonia pannonica]|uniref:hypothetical protein n=1 Tax=Nesterenkonia pannonica TaxID=1548602 RepID=UPI002164E2B2|nr:hypothetical protein [Nesterenkonia pannonica]